MLATRVMRASGNARVSGEDYLYSGVFSLAVPVSTV